MITLLVALAYIVGGVLLWKAGNRLELLRDKNMDVLARTAAEREVLETAKQNIIDLITDEDLFAGKTVTINLPSGPLLDAYVKEEKERLAVQKQEILNRYKKRGSRLSRMGRR